MGNLCSSSSKDDDHFVGTGRTVGSAPPNPPAQRATVPARVGGGSGSAGQALGGKPGSGGDPREAARKAAEGRANKTQQKPPGKLGQKLAEQQKQTRTATLEQASAQERGARAADENAEARQWN
ncbi:MAG: hypothetical protein M1828_002772 [Chrysothrix sp. TS-e1954]|nr:MAG: hypothetical protein M1828_002772 [Chrysothrix sp. TS-e1954]